MGCDSMVKDGVKNPKRARGYIPLPDGDVPETLQCVNLYIPDGAVYKSQLLAALYQLTFWNNWQRDDTGKGAIVARAWSNAIRASIALEACQGGSETMIFRVDGCNFQTSIDDGANWITQFSFDLEACPALQGATGATGATGSTGSTGSTGAQGLPGIDGSPGAKGDKGDPGTMTGYVPPDSGATNDNPTRCYMSQFVCAAIFGVYDDNITAINFAGNVPSAVGVIGGIVGAVLTGVGAVVLVVVGAMSALATLLLNAGAAAASAALDNSDRDTVQQNLYCTLQTQGKIYIDQAVVTAWKALNYTAGAGVVAGADLLGGTIDCFSIGALKQIGEIGALSTSNDCAAMSCGWCHTFDFTASDGGWIVRQNYKYGTWVSGQGWTMQYVSGSSYAVGIERTFTATYIASIEVVWHFVNPDGANYYGITTTPTHAQSAVNPSSSSTVTETFNVASASITKILIADSDNSAHGTPGTHIASVTIRGTGTDPFGTPNCT
jgi:hypothetical protein